VARMPRQAWPEGSPSRRAVNRQRKPVAQGILLVSVPRSPGRKPGDSGFENQPAVHAARRHVTTRLKPTAHGTQEGMPPGVPRLPPGAFCVRDARAPRSPGRKPGDSGFENQPAVHAARRHVTTRLKPTAHGTREGMPPGVPRLPPGAFWIVRASQSESKTGERIPSAAATRDATAADRSTLPRKPHHDR
jgi:hypothetical protein